MKFLFSEASPDYSRYLYPYVVWVIPEPPESPADCFHRGCVIASPQLDRFVLARSVRVDLAHYQPSSENRRILRKGDGITAELIERNAFAYTPERRQAWKHYADHRFGDQIMSFERLDRLMNAPVISHLLLFRETATGAELGTALLFLQPPRAAYYYYAFYELDRLPQNLGIFMMTWAVRHFAAERYQHLYLGTCYSDRALYKTQFPGVEFFNGNTWSTNLKELKYLLHRPTQPPATHLLQDVAYLHQFHHG